MEVGLSQGRLVCNYYKLGRFGRSGMDTGPSILVIASRTDPGGASIASSLLSLLGPRAKREGKDSYVWDRCKLLLVDEEIVRVDRLPESLHPVPDLVIFASRHESQSGMRCLTVHFPGNFSQAELGGEPRRVAMAAPLEMKEALRGLSEAAAGLDYVVSLEATHHGPYTDVPCFFIEVGSRPENWTDQRASLAVASAIEKVTSRVAPNRPVALALGGPHYSERFTALVKETDVALSHIVAKHNVGYLDEETIESLFGRSRPEASFAVLDWKGIQGSDRRRVVSHLEGLGIRYVRLRDCLSKKCP